MTASPLAALIAALVLVGLVGGAYTFGRSDGRALEVAERAKVEEVAATVRKAAMEGAAQEIAKIEIRHTTVRQQLETEIREKPVYRDCRADDRVLQLINAALTGGPVPAGAGQLSGAGTPD